MNLVDKCAGGGPLAERDVVCHGVTPSPASSAKRARAGCAAFRRLARPRPLASMLWGGASRSRKAEALRGLIACRATWAADWEGPSIEGDETARGLGYVVPDSNQSLQGVGPGGHAP